MSLTLGPMANCNIYVTLKICAKITYALGLTFSKSVISKYKGCIRQRYKLNIQFASKLDKTRNHIGRSKKGKKGWKISVTYMLRLSFLVPFNSQTIFQRYDGGYGLPQGSLNAQKRLFEKIWKIGSWRQWLYSDVHGFWQYPGFLAPFDLAFSTFGSVVTQKLFKGVTYGYNLPTNARLWYFEGSWGLVCTLLWAQTWVTLGHRLCEKC